MVSTLCMLLVAAGVTDQWTGHHSHSDSQQQWEYEPVHTSGEKTHITRYIIVDFGGKILLKHLHLSTI